MEQEIVDQINKDIQILKNIPEFKDVIENNTFNSIEDFISAIKNQYIKLLDQFKPYLKIYDTVFEFVSKDIETTLAKIKSYMTYSIQQDFPAPVKLLLHDVRATMIAHDLTIDEFIALIKTIQIIKDRQIYERFGL